MPDTASAPSTTVAQLVLRSHALITGHQHGNGAYPAAPSFSAYQGYAWFRDGAFTADGVSRYGDVASASAFHDWCAAVLTARQDSIDSLVRAARQGVDPPDRQLLPARFTLDGTDGADPWWDFQLDGYGTWLWSLCAHAQRHGLGLARWSTAVAVAVDYLTAFWRRPCYDWWEENPRQHHVSTLGAIYGGLRAVAGALDPDRRRAADQAAADIRALVLAHGVQHGHLTKWLGSAALDASLLACVTPFRLLEPGDPRAAATVRAVREQLAHGYGVHRYAADSFYGGGLWPLLTCLLGWNLHAGGDTEAASACLHWTAAQADRSGQLPEQVGHHLLAPDKRQEWVDRWGTVATPLLWSHGMFLTLASELGLAPAPVAAGTELR